MARDSRLIVGAALIAALVFYSRKASAANAINDAIENASNDWGDYWGGDVSPTGDPYNPGDAQIVTGDEMAKPDERVRAFIWMIGASENSPAAMNSGAAFQTFYGGSRFSDMSDHPVITGEKQGVRLPDDWCIKAGFAPGCVSTAAGFAQFNVPTWRDVREARPMWGPRLPDFSRDSQIEAARRLLMKIGALPFIERGDFETALARASTRWESLPGAQGGQRVRPFAWVQNVYENALGVA